MPKVLSLLVFLFSTELYAEGDILAPEFGEKLRTLGISLSFDKDSVEKLAALAEARIKELSDILISVDLGPDEVEQVEEDLRFINHSKNRFIMARKSGNHKDLYDSYNLLLRVLYAIHARPLENRKIKFGEALRLLNRIRIRIPLIKAPEEPIGPDQALLEAHNLVDPVNPGRYLSPQDLAEFTANEVADLDISNEHTFWLTKSSYANLSIDRWHEIEDWAQSRIQGEIGREAEGFSYDLHTAKKVLFFRKIRDSGTSPKVSAVDAFQAKWKIKWGIEIQTEPVVNDLYLKIGGRYQDLSYNMRTDDYTLILRGGNEDSCDNVRKVETFKKCLKESSYEFDIEHYVGRSGVLSSKNVNTVLKDLPANPTKKYQKHELIGREYLTFKESLLEFDGGDFLTGGGVSSYNQFGSEHDRVRRGLVVFNHFIWNSDAKDENSKLIMVKDYDGQPEYLLETQSDLGASLASPWPGANLNSLKTGDSFAKKTSKNISFRQWVLYEPEAWRRATFADSLWMAKKIVALTKDDLHQAVDRVQWPQFMKDLLLYRLAGRRDRLAEVFGIENLLPPNEMEIKAPTIRYSLETREDREIAASDLGISVQLIEDRLRESGLMDEKGNSNHTDTLALNGKLRPCRKAVLLGLLEKSPYPTGLTRRVNRFRHFKNLKGCAYAS